MIFDRSALHTKLADKSAVRELIIDRIGEKHLVPLIGTYCDFKNIDFDQFPSQFVLKCTHDSGSAIVCRDKGTFDVNRAESKLGCVDTFSLKNSEVVKSNRQTQFYYSLCLVPC